MVGSSDTTAETVADNFISKWVARFGAPSIVTTYRGSNFESNLFKVMLSKLGAVKFRTTACHPASNAMLERYHRRLKYALRVSNQSNSWVAQLPLILLSLRSALRIVPFVDRQRMLMQTTSGIVARHHGSSEKSYIDPHVAKATKVFIMNNHKTCRPRAELPRTLRCDPTFP